MRIPTWRRPTSTRRFGTPLASPKTRRSNWQVEASRRHACLSKGCRALERAGHDAVHASNIGLASATDQMVMQRARAEGRVIVTADLDYPRLLAGQRADGPGIILFRGGSYSDAEMLALLDRVLASGEQLDLEHSITVVDRGRVRSRRLPVSE